MARRAAWLMSEEDIFGTLNAIEDRLTKPGLVQQRFDVLVRLPAMFEADAEAYRDVASMEENNSACAQQARRQPA